MENCKRCGNSEIDKGWILSAGKVAYRSDTMKYPLQGGNMRSYVCLQCGFVESYVTEDYLKKVRDISLK